MHPATWKVESLKYQKGKFQMMIVMKEDATEEQIASVVERVEDIGCSAHVSKGELLTLIGAIGAPNKVAELGLEGHPGVDHLVPISKPYKLASKQFRQAEDSILEIGGRKVGGTNFALMAGPCTVENRDQMLDSADDVAAAGATMLRGGAYKPRTSPYSFQGLGREGLRLLAEAKERTGLPIVTELLDVNDLEDVLEVADVIQIGARNMQNYSLLHAVGYSMKPVLLKRGMSATMEELLMAAEYIMSHGNYNVMLCERGIRTFEKYTRNTTDINAIPVLQELTHLPVIVDPSHGTGKWEYVPAVAKGAVAAGADGLMIEVHPHPDEALSDGSQSLKPERFEELVHQIKQVSEAVGRRLAPSRFEEATGGKLEAQS